MTETEPISCSLDAAAARERLARIQALGARALLSRDEVRGVQIVRFGADRATTTGLEDIVAAESRCCPFLDLTLDEEGDRIVLTIGAGPEALPVATMLAEAFEPAKGAAVGAGRGGPGRRLRAGLGAGAVMALLCCVGAPLLLGGVLGAALGGAGDAVLGVAAIAAGAYALRQRRSRRRECGC